MSGWVGGGLIGIQINGHILGRQSVYLPKDYCCHQVKNLSSSREGLIYALKRFLAKKNYSESARIIVRIVLFFFSLL